MELQHRIALLPTEAQMVSVHLAVTCLDEQLTFLNASGPIFTCRADDEGARRFAAVMLTEPSLGLATTTEVAKALGRHRSRVHDYRKRYRDGGAEVLEVKRRGPRGASKLKGEPLTRAQQCLDEGLSNRKVAQAVGLSEGTIRKALKANRLSRVKRTEAHSAPSPQRPASTPRERTEADASCAGGVATTREEERALASTGQLPEAPVRFEAAQSVAKAGVLVALPALLSQGLLEVGQNIYAKLKNGYYGLTTMLLTFGLMALVRVKSAEGLTHYAPGEFGLVLGLDRAPEMKTVRRKLCELASRGRALEFARAFANRWTEQAPDTLGYLYIDGHVRPYHGRTHELPKTHVQRRRLCMPATTDYWVNDTDAQPLMFVTAPANEGLLAMMDDELLPEIRKLAGEARRVTLIFDREGWSPKRFKHWHSTGFDVITYRKGKYREWQRRAFKEVTVEVCGRKVKYLLGERLLPVAKGFRMREVRRLCDDGHQTSVVTTRRDLALETVALRMFSRWQQENFFRYMRHEFALDHLPTTAVEPADPLRSVPNPAVKEKRRELSRVKAELAQAEQAYGQHALENPEHETRTLREFKIIHAELGCKIEALRCEQAQRFADLKALPKRVAVRERMDGAPVVQLERERKIITDTFKMVAYRAETQLANLVGPLLPHRDDEARKFMRQVFELPADLLPDYARGTLTVRLHSMATPRHNRVLASLCGVLNDLVLPRHRTPAGSGGPAAGARVAIIIGACPGLCNGRHEEGVAALMREHLPSVPATVSSELVPQIQEYERTSTAVINAYIRPVVERYMHALRDRLQRLGINVPINIMQSNGGVLSAATAARKPIFIIESGPAAGVVGAQRIGELNGLGDILAFDMGGTTAKAAIIVDGAFGMTPETEVGGGESLGHRMVRGGGYVVQAPTIDIAEVGAGGGSIARIDAGGALQVGPRSAGAQPGPVCYAKGGTAATVTDANLVLGYLNPETLVGGDLALDLEGVAAAITALGASLGKSVTDTAYGIHLIANARMMRALSAVSSERGLDPARFAMFAFGGNGGVHACGLAESLGVVRVVVPPAAGLFSALGLIFADAAHQCIRAFYHRLDALDVNELNTEFDALQAEAVGLLTEDGYAQALQTLEHVVEMKYIGQNAALSVQVEGLPLDGSRLAGLAEDFALAHLATFGYRSDDEGLQIVSLTVVARGRSATSRVPARIVLERDAGETPPARRVHYGDGEGWLDAPVLTRDKLDGTPRPGPAIV